MADQKYNQLDYCQYLLNSHINYTITNLADHLESTSHDRINRYLKNEKLTPNLLWKTVKNLIIFDEDGYIIFDDTVLDKRHSYKIELVRRQYSGNAKKVIKGIGVVNCIYVNKRTGEFWIIDYRIYDKDGDGKSKLDHLEDMLNNIIYHKQIPFKTVLMDSWYATKRIILLIEKLNKVYYCPLKKNRLVDDSYRKNSYQNIEKLAGSEPELKEGKIVKINKFPKNHKVKLFRVSISTNRTDYVITNDKTQESTDAVKIECSIRWKIEEFHREEKQLTGIESCQCRKGRIQRNHINCAILVWVKLKQIAYSTQKTVYEIKHSLLSNYLKKELKSPSIIMSFA
jgi:hypothetical protein